MLKAVWPMLHTLHSNWLANGARPSPVHAAQGTWCIWRRGAASRRSAPAATSAARTPPHGEAAHGLDSGDAASVLVHNRTELVAGLGRWQQGKGDGQWRRAVQPSCCNRRPSEAVGDSAGASPVSARTHLGSRLLGTADLVMPRYLGSVLLRQQHQHQKQPVGDAKQLDEPMQPHQQHEQHKQQALFHPAISASMSRSLPIVAAASLLAKHNLAELATGSSMSGTGSGHAIHGSWDDGWRCLDRQQAFEQQHLLLEEPPSPLMPAAATKLPWQLASRAQATGLSTTALRDASTPHSPAMQPQLVQGQLQQHRQQPPLQQAMWQQHQQQRQPWQQPVKQPRQALQQQQQQVQQVQQVQPLQPQLPKPPPPPQGQLLPKRPPPPQQQPIPGFVSQASHQPTRSSSAATPSTNLPSGAAQQEPDPEDLLHDLAEQLAERGIELDRLRFGTQRPMCPDCSGGSTSESSFAVTISETGAVWCCHRATCGFKGGVQARLGGARRWRPASERHHHVEPAKVILPPTHQLRPLSKDLLDWFQSRGISQATLTDRRNGTAMEARPAIGSYDEQQKVDTIAFPFWRDGKVVNIKYRQLPKKFSQTKHGEQVLYGLDDIKGQQVVILVEGEMDKLALNEAGFWNAASVPGGASVPKSETKLRYLLSAEAALAQSSLVLLATDADEPGQALAAQLAQRLGPARCGVFDWPEGCKDANDVLMQHGREVLNAWVWHEAERIRYQLA